MCPIVVKCLLWCSLLTDIFTGRPASRIGLAEGAVTRSDINYEQFATVQISSKQPHNRTSKLLDEREPTASSPWTASIYHSWQDSPRIVYLNDKGEMERASDTLARRFRFVFGKPHGMKVKRRKHISRWVKPEPFRPSRARLLENTYDEANGNDDNYKDVDDKYTDDGVNTNSYLSSAADERCSAFLVSFLEGTTDAHDTCEGMMNAYTAAGKTFR